LPGLNPFSYASNPGSSSENIIVILVAEKFFPKFNYK
jgi:hypothetical protein